jgi:hypothetical protein
VSTELAFAVCGRRRGIPVGSFRFKNWAVDTEAYAEASNQNAMKRVTDKARGSSGGATYLDLAAASEAEALQPKKGGADRDPLDSPNNILPPSDLGSSSGMSSSGIGRRV